MMRRLVAEAQSAHRPLERIRAVGEYRTLRASERKSRQLVSRAHLSTSGQPRATVYFADHLSPDPPTVTSVHPPTGYREQEADHRVKLAKQSLWRRLFPDDEKVPPHTEENLDDETDALDEDNKLRRGVADGGVADGGVAGGGGLGGGEAGGEETDGGGA
ncbi:hypothetical protein PG987_010078 [Apiospora arundinis]